MCFDLALATLMKSLSFFLVTTAGDVGVGAGAGAGARVGVEAAGLLPRLIEMTEETAGNVKNITEFRNKAANTFGRAMTEAKNHKCIIYEKCLSKSLMLLGVHIHGT